VRTGVCLVLNGGSTQHAQREDVKDNADSKVGANEVREELHAKLEGEVLDGADGIGCREGAEGRPCSRGGQR
jgi:hypothetical protein